MIHLTAKEKANRYDALQMAIYHTVESYKRRLETDEKRYVEAQDFGVIGSYSKGMADALSMVIADIERWDDSV